MSITCTHPHTALFAAALLLLALLVTLTHPRRSLRWCLAGILLPLASAALIALALSKISLTSTPPITLTLDFSPSARTSPWHDPAWVQRLAQARLAPNQPLTLLSFDGTRYQSLLPQTTPSNPWPAAFPTSPPPIPSATPNPNHPQWLLTDGITPPPKFPPAPAAITLLRPTAIDLAIQNLLTHPTRPTSPTTPAIELLINIRAVAWPNPTQPLPKKITAQLTLTRDNTPLTQLPIDFTVPNATSPLDVSRWITFRDSPDPNAPHTYAAHIVLTTAADPWPENDSGSMVYSGLPEMPRVLTISNSLPPSPTTVRPDVFFQLPQRLAAQAWQTIILDDIPAHASPGGIDIAPISAAAARSLDTFVRQAGAGLLILSRAHAFGPGHYGESGTGNDSSEILENLSPLHSHPHSGPNLHLIFLLDASASMNENVGTERKISLLSRAITQTTHLLSTDDHLTVITFNQHSQLLADGSTRETDSTLAPKLAGIDPQGQTAPDSTLELLATSLAIPSPQRKLILLLTDGEIPALDIPRWKRVVSTHPFLLIAPALPATSPLQTLTAAIPTAHLIPTPDPAAWADTLRNSLLSHLPGTLQLTQLPWKSNNLNATAPSFISTWLKPESQLLAQGPEQQPVAAIAQRGLGKVAALAIPDDNSPAYTSLKQELLRQITPPPGDPRFHTTTRRQPDGTWLITTDAYDNNAFLNHQSLTIQQISPDSTTSATLPPTPMQQTAPGRYQTQLTAPNGLTAIITRNKTDRIATIQTPTLQTTEFPASINTPWTPNPNQTLLPSSLDGSNHWQIPTTTDPLTSVLWLAALLTTLIALWLRS